MPRIRAGALRHRIAIQRKVIERNPASGAVIESWQTVPGLSSVPAEIAPLSTREFLSAAQMQSEIRGRIIIRYIPGVALDATMRAYQADTGLVYQFAGTPFVDAETGRDRLTIPVSEGVIEG